MDEQLRQSWERTGVALDAALATIPGGLEEHLTEYRECREHNELGLAFDLLVYLAQERNAQAECWDALLVAAREMGVTPSHPVHGEQAAVVFARHHQ